MIFEVVIKQRMVFGDQLKLHAAKAVAARITAVADVGAVVGEQHADDGRAHAALANVSLGSFKDAPVGELDAGHEAVLFVFEPLLFFVGPGLFFVRRGHFEEIGHRVDRNF